MTVLRTASQGEGGAGFLKLFLKMAAAIAAMPQGQINNLDSEYGKAHLHYFHGKNDWYIFEKQWDGGVDRAYGYAILGGDLQNAGYGYIDIGELVANGAELDLYFKPQAVAQALEKRA
jgi:hypothetical protein